MNQLPRLVATLCVCLSFSSLSHAGDSEPEGTAAGSGSSVGGKIKHAVSRGAEAANNGIERGAKATLHGIERGTKATADAAARVSGRLSPSGKHASAADQKGSSPSGEGEAAR